MSVFLLISYLFCHRCYVRFCLLNRPAATQRVCLPSLRLIFAYPRGRDACRHREMFGCPPGYGRHLNPHEDVYCHPRGALYQRCLQSQLEVGVEGLIYDIHVARVKVCAKPVEFFYVQECWGRNVLKKCREFR